MIATYRPVHTEMDPLVCGSLTSTKLPDGRNHGHRPRTCRSMELSGVDWERITVSSRVCQCGRPLLRHAEFCDVCTATAHRALNGDTGAFLELIALRD